MWVISKFILMYKKHFWFLKIAFFQLKSFVLNSTQGVPFENGEFSSADQLTEVFMCVIFSSSVVHAAANFPQYDAYGFPPNYPSKLKGFPPKNKVSKTNRNFLHSLYNTHPISFIFNIVAI